MIDIAQIRARLAASVGGEARLASWYMARTMRDLDARAARELDSAAADCQAMLERVRKALVDADQLDYRQCSDEELVARYVRFWAAWQAAGSRVANWMVTGPARFPVHSNNKRIASEDRRYQELADWRNAAPAQAVKRARKARADAIGAGGQAAVELAELKANLARREARQAMMKAVNAQIRKAKLGEGDGEQLAAWCKAAGYAIGAGVAAALLKPDWGPRGFAAYQLSNNNAEIRRLEQRIAQVSAKVERIEAADQVEPAAQVIAGVELVENAAEDRLQLIFPGKPADHVRAALKGRGFRWSPRAGAWQRQLTNAARDAAQSILRQLEPA